MWKLRLGLLARIELDEGLEEVFGIGHERHTQLLQVCTEAAQALGEEPIAAVVGDVGISSISPVKGAEVLEYAYAFEMRWPKWYLAGELYISTELA